MQWCAKWIFTTHARYVANLEILVRLLITGLCAVTFLPPSGITVYARADLSGAVNNWAMTNN